MVMLIDKDRAGRRSEFFLDNFFKIRTNYCVLVPTQSRFIVQLPPGELSASYDKFITNTIL